MMQEKLKIGVIGLGKRGRGLVNNILKNSTLAEITAVCDKFSDRMEMVCDKVEKSGCVRPKAFENYKQVLRQQLDAVIVSTSWDMHVAVALEAMESDLPVAIEVGGTYNIADCWKLVDCYERTKTPFMFLENCCYNKDELLITNLIRHGVLGDISYCQGMYAHDLREEIIKEGLDNNHYRLQEYIEHNCENYPTHELGPIAKILGINRGNRFVQLVSMASKAQGLKAYLEDNQSYAERLKGVTFNQGDVVTTMIKCENGETILLKLDTTLPVPFDRGITINGTKGYYCQTTESVLLDSDHEKKKKEQFFTQDNYNEYLPQDWQNITKEQIEAGHGGMDYIMLQQFFLALKNGEDMPIDVYDAVAWMSITALSEESIKKGSLPVAVPDFTRGKYKDRPNIDVIPLPIIKKGS